MKRKKTQIGKKALVVLSTAALFAACTREKINSNQQADETVQSNNSLFVNQNGNSAAAHISASEKLTIPEAVALPANLPGGNSRVATFYAVGVQKYKAQVIEGSNPVAYKWVFVAPQADLYDATNAKAGTHGAGPHWQLSIGDSIFAQQFSPARTAPSPDAESIDWLLLRPKNGTAPTGAFADVDYIQRIATKGGKAPLTPPASVTETAEVKYQAVYRFSKQN